MSRSFAPLGRVSRRSSFARSNTLAMACLMLGAAAGPARGQTPEAGYVTVQAAAVTPHAEAYGQVEPAATLTVSFAEAGVVAGLGQTPGAQVHAGQELAHLEGPEAQSAILAGEAQVRSAQQQLSAAQKSLAQRRAQLTSGTGTTEAVQDAEADTAEAQTALDDARSNLEIARQGLILKAPVDATVLMANATDGELVSAAQPILTLQTPYRLWLHAVYYGFDLASVRAGMTGKFTPADGSEPIPVRVTAVFGLLEAGGGVSITLVPATPAARWLDGQFGTVALDLPPQSLVAVPTRALILDQGKWWVMVHTPQGDRPQAVVPGPARGWQTFIEQGLKPGTQVAVDNAYLLFHHNIQQQYQPPD